MNPSAKVSLALVMILGLSGCYFTSKNPLPMKAGGDKELLGCWRSIPGQKNPTTDGYALFVNDQDGWMQITLMENYYENGEVYRGFCSEIKGEKYLNVKKINFGKETRQPELDANYYVVRYRIAGHKRLEMTLLNETLFKQAVKARTLAGDLSPKADDLNLTCTTEQLAAFLSRHKPAELLGEPMTPMEKTNQLPKAGKP